MRAMRASKLLGLPVRDPAGTCRGVVVDVLVDVPDPGRTAPGWDIAGIVIAPPSPRTAWAHFTGLTYSRQRGPWPLTRPGHRAAGESRLVPASRVLSWSSDGLVVEAGAGTTFEDAGP